MTAYRQIVSGNTIVWKLVTLVDKPADEEVTYNGQNQTPAAISSINGELVTAAAQSTTFKNASTYPITLTLDADDALWSDGDTSLTYTFDFIIDKKLIATPDVSQTSFTYSGEEIKLDIAESDYYTIEDAAKTEAGEYTAKLTLTDPENTAWADTTAITLGINFKILISDEMSLLWLVLLLAAILIEELVVSNIYWHKRSRVHVENVQTSTGDEELDEQSRITEDDIKGYTEGYDDNDDNNNNINNINNNAFSVAPFGLVLLAVHAPTWQIVAISLLSAAIILVAACNIVHAIRQNRIEAEEHNYEGLVPDGADRRHYDSVSPSSDTFITFVPPMPSPYEDENIRVPDGSDFTARKIIVNGCGDIPNPNPAMRNGTVITYNNSQTDTGSKPDEIMSADDEEVDAAELPADVKPVEERIAVRDENGEVAEVLRGIDYNTDTAYVIRYKKSFTARLIQAWDDSKDYYTELKNEALSYEGAKSRVSWDYDCISINLIPVIKFDIRGKTLCMYTPLKPEDYSGSRFEVERSKVKKCEDVPCLYRIKNRTCVNYAKELIAVAMLRFNAKQGNIIRKNYSKPYESIQTLVEMELAKEYLAKEKYSEFLKKSEKVGEAEKLNNTSDAEETKPLIDMDEEDIEEVRVVDKATGEEVIKRYNKSFTAKLIQASDETKSFYTTLKNEILSYNKTRSTIWWNCDSIHTSNKTIARFGIQDGVLCLYVALKPSDYTNLYPVEKAVGKRYAHVPCMFRIKNNKRCNDALRLIDTLAQKCGLERGTQKTEDYFRPFDTTENLLDMGLIKEVGSKENSEEKKRLSRKTVEDKRKVKVSCQDVNKIIDDDTAIILVENKRSGKNYSGKKQEIGIDAISSAYAAGEVVNIESLKQKGLIPQDVGYIKILARGELDKPLTVEANDFSIGAVKMIILTGGTARKV
jgi:ribosomal protein L15